VIEPALRTGHIVAVRSFWSASIPFSNAVLSVVESSVVARP
jgi:hypothetical protein